MREVDCILKPETGDLFVAEGQSDYVAKELHSLSPRSVNLTVWEALYAV